MNDANNILAILSELPATVLMGLVVLGAIAVALSSLKLVHKILDKSHDQ